MASTFSHEGLHLRTIEQKDLQQIAELRNDQTTWTQLTDPRPLGPADQKAWYESLGSRSGKLYFVAYDDQNPFIGLIRMDEIDHLNRSIRIGADVLVNLRGKGFGKAIYRTLLKYCFDHLNMNRVWLAVLNSNTTAKGLYARMGFQEEGRYREAVYRDGAYVDYLLMSVLKKEYLAATRKEATVSVLVLSYNRPRMLVEALDSIEGADEVIILDDASSFDIQALVAPYLKRFPKSQIRIAPPVSTEERLKTPRLGAAINKGIWASQCDVITYLCDDDLFHKDWIRKVREVFTEYNDVHCVRAPWGEFKDGEQPGAKLCNLAAAFDMTTGNFAHRRSCSLDHNVWWDETSVAVHDRWFLMKGLFPVHPLQSIPKLPGLAGWRREHDYNMTKLTNSDGYLDSAAEVLNRKVLE